MLDLLQRKAGDSGGVIPVRSAQAGWAWDRATIAAQAERLRVAAPAGLATEIARAMAQIRANGLDIDSVEQEDMRLPAFARLVPALHRCLDDGPGFLILTGLDLDPYVGGRGGDCRLGPRELSG